MRISSGMPPTTRATPGTTPMPIHSSCQRKRRRASHGSSTARNTGAIAMQVAPTEAFESLIEA